MRIPHVKFVAAGVLIIGTISYLMFSGINDSMVYYYTVSELKAQGSALVGRGLRVSGYVLPGSIEAESSGTSVKFVVYDKKTDDTLPVVYRGLIPDTFKDNAEVVVEGEYLAAGTAFQATTLLAKCPSKYEKMGDEHPGESPQTEKVSLAR